MQKSINEQEGLYTLYLRGSENGQKVDDKRVFEASDLIEGKVAILKQGKKNNFLLKTV